MTVAAAPDAERAAERVLAAAHPRDVFGDKTTAREVKATYRMLARLLHPDTCRHQHATEAMVRLNGLYEEALEMLVSGRYKDKPRWTARTRRGARYALDAEPRWHGDACDVFVGESTTSLGPVFMKLARSPTDADLRQREQKALKTVLASPHAEDMVLKGYVPRLLDSFRVPVKGSQHRANVFAFEEGMVSLVDVARLFPNGVDPRDASWMFRRLLWCLSGVHSAGVCHGAVLPQHVLIRPETHDVILIGWGASTTDAGPRGYRPRNHSYLVPRALADRAAARINLLPRHDVEMAANTFAWLCGKSLPDQLRAFFRGCNDPALPDALKVRDEYTDLIERLWGERTFREFKLPAR